MTSILVGLGILAAFGLLLWAIIRKAERAAVKEAEADRAKADSEAQERANDVLRERRDPDNAVDRLQSGKF